MVSRITKGDNMTNQKRKSQKNAVLQYLLDGNTLTTIEAVDMFGCTRLPARISDYRKEGYRIADVWVENTTRYGTPTRYKAYKVVM
jgi:hypothetical protein